MSINSGYNQIQREKELQKLMMEHQTDVSSAKFMPSSSAADDSPPLECGDFREKIVNVPLGRGQLYLSIPNLQSYNSSFENSQEREGRFKKARYNVKWHF